MGYHRLPLRYFVQLYSVTTSSFGFLETSAKCVCHPLQPQRIAEAPPFPKDLNIGHARRSPPLQHPMYARMVRNGSTDSASLLAVCRSSKIPGTAVKCNTPVKALFHGSFVDTTGSECHLFRQARVDPMTKASKYVELGSIHHKAKDPVA